MPFEISGKKARAFCEKQIALALEKTDPDPTAHQPKVNDAKKDIDTFRSVVDLIHPDSPAVKYPQLYATAEAFEAQVRNLSIPELLIHLKELEARVFRYDEKSHEAPVADLTAFLSLKNWLKAIERIAFENPEYLAQADRPEIRRLSILAAPDLNSQSRGLIYRIEKENPSLQEMFEMGHSNTLQFLKSFDGEVLLFDDGDWKNGLVVNQYFRSRFSEEEIVKVAREYHQKYREEYKTALMARGLSPEYLEVLPKLNDPELIEFSKNLFLEGRNAQNSEERVQHFLKSYAFFVELGVRGFTQTQGEIAMIDSLISMFQQAYKDKWTPDLLDKIKKPFVAARRAFETESRLDNYKVRNDFLSAISESIRLELERGGSALNQCQNDFFFNMFMGHYIFDAKSAKIPFGVSDLLAQSANLYHEKVLPDDILWTKPEPAHWADVFKKGRLVVPFEAYPRSDNPLESELDVLKEIAYRGVPVYDLAVQSVDTVALDSTLKIEGAAGFARALFKNIEVEYANPQNGFLKPFYERLQILAHEIFHNMDGYKNLSGFFPAGNRSSILAERGAYLFSAYILKEYFKMRLSHTESPFLEEEKEAILKAMADDHLAAKTANFHISELLPGFDSEDRRIELPLDIQMKAATAARQFPHIVNIHPGERIHQLKFIVSWMGIKDKRKEIEIYLKIIVDELRSFVTRQSQKVHRADDFFLALEKQRIAEEIEAELAEEKFPLNPIINYDH